MIYSANTQPGKRVTIQKFWPLFGDKKRTSDRPVMSKEMMQEIIKVHNLTHLMN